MRVLRIDDVAAFNLGQVECVDMLLGTGLGASPPPHSCEGHTLALNRLLEFCKPGLSATVQCESFPALDVANIFTVAGDEGACEEAAAAISELATEFTGPADDAATVTIAW